MPNLGFLIDNRKCIGCHACSVACKSEHEVPLGVDRTWVKYVEKGVFPNNRRHFTVMRCNHCEAAPCVTICPVTALFQADSGIVDFESDRCIGCKACLQACPYDALYIDPETDTAAKCNFCSDRLEVGLEPSCVAVCPEQAIVMGDLNDPASQISTLVNQHAVTVRKPEKGTRPNLFYIEGDESALVPSRTETDGRTMWSNGAATADTTGDEQGRTVSLPIATDDGSPRRVYDVRPRPAAWGWSVAGYVWAKSIAAGAFLAALVGHWASEGATESVGMSMALGGVALAFLALTLVLLVVDLKKPGRFLYVLLRPQWRSWLVRGAYVLMAYGGVLVLWMVAHMAGSRTMATVLGGLGAVLAVLAAVYTAFLFAQAKGRDFWQNPLLAVHLLGHAFVAGAAVWLLADTVKGSAGLGSPGAWLAGSIVVSAIGLLAEIFTTPATDDAHRALRMIVKRPFGLWFWGGGIVAGHLLPLLLLTIGLAATNVLAALLVVAAIFVIEMLWVAAPQRVPLS